VKHFDNDLVTFGLRVKQFGNNLAIGSDYFMVTAKHLVTISKYSTTKTRLTTIYYCTELKCYHLTMTSRTTSQSFHLATTIPKCIASLQI
jgi:hypothetical protein